MNTIFHHSILEYQNFLSKVIFIQAEEISMRFANDISCPPLQKGAIQRLVESGRVPQHVFQGENLNNDKSRLPEN